MATAYRTHKPISIHAPRVGSDQEQRRFDRDADILIHAPRVGSDTQMEAVRVLRDISIHAPRVGSDSFPVSG